MRPAATTRGTILRGLAWHGSTAAVARGVRWITLLVLGRLLSPGDFGVFASLYVIVDGLYLLQGFGLGQAFVVRRDRWQESADVTFQLSLVFGVVATGAAWALAPAVERFYGQPHVQLPFRILSLVLLANALRVVPSRLLERSLEFHRRVLPTMAGVLAYVITALVLAMSGHGVWALVLGVLAATGVETVAFWIGTSWRPRWKWHADVARQDVRFGASVALGSVLGFAYHAMDRVVLARFGGPLVVGPYAFSHSLTTMPLTSGAAAINTVLLPSYGRTTGMEQRFTIHQRSAGLASGIGILFALLVVFFGSDALRAAYGAKWDAAIVVLRILACGAVLRLLTALAGEYLVGCGDSRGYRTMNLVQTGLAAILVAPAFAWKAGEGVALAMTVATAAALGWGWSAIHRDSGKSWRQQLETFGGPLGAGTATIPAAVVASVWLSRPAAPITIALSVAAVALVYAATWWAFDANLRRLVRARRERKDDATPPTGRHDRGPDSP